MGGGLIWAGNHGIKRYVTKWSLDYAIVVSCHIHLGNIALPALTSQCLPKNKDSIECTAKSHQSPTCSIENSKTESILILETMHCPKQANRRRQ